MRLFQILIITCALVVLAVPTAPASHAVEESSGFVVLHDVPDSGYTYVGNPVQFAAIKVNPDGSPTTHQDVPIRVTQNGIVLYETSSTAGHDYDGLNPFTIAFPSSGPYTVTALDGASHEHGQSLSAARDAALDHGHETNVFEGFVYPADHTTNATVEVQRTSEAAALGLTSFEVQVLDDDGQIIPHSDALIEIRRASDGWLLFRTHLHTHDEPMSFAYGFETPGEYEVSATGYMAFPTKTGERFAATTQSIPVSVQAPQGVPEPDPSTIPLPEAMGQNSTQLYSSIDPYASNTPASRTTISGLVWDPEASGFVPHVNFVALVRHQVTGHVAFYSDSLHEYDGNFDFTIQRTVPGPYEAVLVAERGDWIKRTTVEFLVAEVLPPELLPSGGGAVIVDAPQILSATSGRPTSVTFTAMTQAGTPAMHSEIDFQLLRTTGGPPILQNKIHTHGSGTFDVDITFPDAGSYVLVLDPLVIHGDPTVQFYWQDVGGALQVPLTVAEGETFPTTLPELDDPALPAPEDAASLPGAGAWFALLAGSVAVALRRRR